MDFRISGLEEERFQDLFGQPSEALARHGLHITRTSGIRPQLEKLPLERMTPAVSIATSVPVPIARSMPRRVALVAKPRSRASAWITANPIT